MFVQVVTSFFFTIMCVIIFAVGQELASHCSLSHQGFISSCVNASYSSPFKKLSIFGVFTTIRHVYTLYIMTLFFKMLVQLLNDLK